MMVPCFLQLRVVMMMKNCCNEIPWKNDEAIVFGKQDITKRKVAWFGDSAYRYPYSGVTKQAHLRTAE